MSRDLPAWALRRAAAGDRELVRQAMDRDALTIRWPDRRTLRTWARRRRWPNPWFGFERAFLDHMLRDDAAFAAAIGESGLEMELPVQTCTLPDERLRELDALYEEHSPEGRATGWNAMVPKLREIRRAVEAGVVVTVEEGRTLDSWQTFYEWAHGRYHCLEDGADSWIGDDQS